MTNVGLPGALRNHPDRKRRLQYTAGFYGQTISSIPFSPHSIWQLVSAAVSASLPMSRAAVNVVPAGIALYLPARKQQQSRQNLSSSCLSEVQGYVTKGLDPHLGLEHRYHCNSHTPSRQSRCQRNHVSKTARYLAALSYAAAALGMLFRRAVRHAYSKGGESEKNIDQVISKWWDIRHILLFRKQRTTRRQLATKQPALLSFVSVSQRESSPHNTS